MCFRKRNVRNSDRTIACVLTFVALIVGTVVQSWAEQTDPALALTEGVITLHSAGLSEDALPLAEKARRLLQERAEKRPNDYAMTLSNLAAVNLALGRMSEAEHQLREALAINERGL
jgi:tetratricopeptide (TPR) repeat protein